MLDNFIFFQAENHIRVYYASRGLGDLYKRQDRVDASGGGAGLGLRRILEHSDVVAVRVAAGRESRVLCVVDLGEARRRATQPKSLLFCLQ